MGTVIHLSLARLQIDWGKNEYYSNHRILFQEQDLNTVPDYGYEEAVIMEGYSRPLKKIIKRIELIGYTLEAVEREYLNSKDEWGDIIERPILFEEIVALVKKIKINDVTGKWSESQESKFIPNDILALILSKHSSSYNYGTGSRPDYWEIEMLLNGLSPYAKLRLLAENAENLELPVIWPFGDLVESGWADREDFMGKLDSQQKFLVVTEGSSDSKIIHHALHLLRSDYADFFTFIDMEEGYPFSGTGNLYKFCQGLVSIGILNKVIILYDNDAEGFSKYEATKKLALPNNMVVCKLPDIDALRAVDTVGPNGLSKDDINGRAASIECYLDLTPSSNIPQSVVRWSTYIEIAGRYQGALENKTKYMRRFLDLRLREKGYDFSKIEFVLDEIYKAAISMYTT